MENPHYRLIGRGNCGSVWALEGHDWVIKREHGTPGRSVLNDQTMHERVLVAIDTHSIPVLIPRSYNIIEATDSRWWQSPHTGLALFPTHTEPCRAHRLERIPTMPNSVRETLIGRYCPKELQPFVRTNRDDEDCLIRLYLGSRRTRLDSHQKFTLRNYTLHLDQMEELGIDTHAVASALADALAHCYWRACIDADGVEFVLAPSRGTSDADIPHVKAFGGEYAIWMLDYDYCQEMSQNEAGVDQAVHAFQMNDSYFPQLYESHQTEEDRSLWHTFRTRFLDTSSEILRERLLSRLDDSSMAKGKEIEEDPAFLANYFIKAIEDPNERRRHRSNRLPERFAGEGTFRIAGIRDLRGIFPE